MASDESMKKVSIVISNRNDTTMLAVTVRSCIEELKPIGHDKSEIIICDNSDQEIYNLMNSYLPTQYIRDRFLKVFRQDFPCLFTARETAIRESSSEYVICLDSHMIVGRDMILDLVNFMNERKEDETIGFAHAPINWAHQHEKRSRHDRDMSENELGDWGTVRDTEGTITWKGIPWICRRNWFLDKDEGLGGYGALADYKVSWGGGDIHIGIKPWLLGFKNWAVPTSPGIHIGPFPKVDVGKNPNVSKVNPAHARDKYRLYAESGNFPHTFGFLVACYVLGGESMMHRNKDAITERFGSFINVNKEWNKAIEVGKAEREWLLSKQKISFEELLKTKPWDN